jgi:NAD(P)-dependent dehydrogenase (short-subunit alcohol dehydrogenase family)
VPTVLITGGSKGIGKATANLLRSRGWKALIPSHDECDVTDIISIQSYVQRLQRTRMIRYIDALVLNAHPWYSRPRVAQMWGDFLDQQLYVIGHWYLMREVLAHSASIQCVIGVSSICLITMMNGYAREYKGVRFNSVCVGLTETDMGHVIEERGGVWHQNAIAQSPGVVADTIAFLVDTHSTTTGVSIR